MSIEETLEECEDGTEWIELPSDFFRRPNAVCDEIIRKAEELERVRRLDGRRPTYFGVPEDFR